MREDQSGSEGAFQGLKGLLCILGEVPSHTLASKTGKRDNNVGVFQDESSVEVCKAKERLDVFHLPGFRPILYGLDFCGVHLQTIFR